jgi:hypothetical protein
MNIILLIDGKVNRFIIKKNRYKMYLFFNLLKRNHAVHLMFIKGMMHLSVPLLAERSMSSMQALSSVSKLLYTSVSIIALSAQDFEPFTIGPILSVTFIIEHGL